MKHSEDNSTDTELLFNSQNDFPETSSPMEFEGSEAAKRLTDTTHGHLDYIAKFMANPLLPDQTNR